MKTQIENLKQELREFLELSKTYMNVSPAMAECLLVAVEGLEMIAFIQENRDLSFNGRNAFDKLQQILNIWEAAK